MPSTVGIEGPDFVQEGGSSRHFECFEDNEIIIHRFRQRNICTWIRISEINCRIFDNSDEMLHRLDKTDNFLLYSKKSKI